MSVLFLRRQFFFLFIPGMFVKSWIKGKVIVFFIANVAHKRFGDSTLETTSTCLQLNWNNWIIWSHRCSVVIVLVYWSVYQKFRTPSLCDWSCRNMEEHSLAFKSSTHQNCEVSVRYGLQDFLQSATELSFVLFHTVISWGIDWLIDIWTFSCSCRMM